MTTLSTSRFLPQSVLPAALALVMAAAHHPAWAQTAPAASGPTVAAGVQALPDFADLAQQVGPAVVNIRTTARVRSGGGFQDEDIQEFFRRFFEMPMPNAPRQPRRNRPQEPSEEEVPRGFGSGFIISSDGYVLTNAHVVDDADEVLVTLTDKRELKAKIIGADRRTDVALLRIEATGLPAVRIGDVNRLRVGEWVMAIGSPFGLENTVTAGIVSAKQRDTGDYLPFIQTDVAVNPGNSGGPLINMRGEVVGINSQIYSRSGGFMGISFAIPIDEAVRVSDQLRAHGRVSRGRIGVQISEVSREVAEAIGLGKTQGALVSSVEPDSPAEKAGVEAGDIITKFDGKPVEKMSDLPRMVGNTKPGTRSNVTVFRRGQSRDLGITIAEVASGPASKASDSAAAREGAKSGASSKAHGLSVRELTDAQRKNLKTKRGVLVESATDAAARAGLRSGDVILSVGNAEIQNVREFEAALAKADQGKPINMLVQRGDVVQFVLLRPKR